MKRILIADPVEEIEGLLVHITLSAGFEPVRYDAMAEPLPDADALVVDPSHRQARELIAALRARRPDLPVLFVAVTWIPEDLTALPNTRTLVKPFRTAEFRAELHELVGASASSQLA